MDQSKTFQNLLVLEQARDTAKEVLLEKYDEVVTPFIHIIQQIMKANNEGHFEATKRILENRVLVDSKEKVTLFSAALMEIVEEVNLKVLK